ncbi:hypothetical protein KU6B_36320 [Mameliella alba]|nr:hypothetical protein KU6B_36320 [Mameliella alba]
MEPYGTAIFNGDLPVSPILRAKAEEGRRWSVSFGERACNQYRLYRVTVRDACTVAIGRAGTEPRLFKVMAPGRHFAVNALGVLAVADALGLDPAVTVMGLGQWHPGAGRGQREKIMLDPVDARISVELIDDAYNANPASLAASLEVLAAAQPRHDVGRVARGRRIAYLGDMKELGSGEVELHRAVAGNPALQRIDLVHCIGPLMQHLWRELPADKRGHWTETSDKMAERVARDLDAGDVVLAKGSLSMGVGRVVDAIRKLRQATPDLDG